MSKFFNLLPFCAYLSEEFNSCLYDMRSGEMIEMSGKYEDFLNRTVINKEAIMEEDNTTINEFLNLDYGRICDKKVYTPYFSYGLKDENYERVYKFNTTVKTFF